MINKVFISHQRLLLMGIATLLLPSACLEAYSEPDTHNNVILSYQDTQIIVGSAAQVLLKQNTLTTLLNHCATKFKHLHDSAHTASQDWQKKHATIITKAIDINRYISKTIETHDSSFAAEKFYLKIDSQVYDSTQQFKVDLENKSRKQQHYLCNRLILSTAMGDRDLVKVIPEHYQRVNKFKLKE